MNEHQLYSLRTFEPVIQMKEHTDFLKAFKGCLMQGMKMHANASTQLDFCLLLQMLRWEVNVPLFRRMTDDLASYHRYEASFRYYSRSLLSAMFNQKRMHETWVSMQKIRLMITLQEMTFLATTFYCENGWGTPNDLKRELELLA